MNEEIKVTNVDTEPVLVDDYDNTETIIINGHEPVVETFAEDGLNEEDSVVVSEEETVAEEHVPVKMNAMDEDVINSGSEFIEEEDIDDFKLLGLKSKINDIGRIVEQLKSEQNSVLGENGVDYGDYLDDVVNGYTLEDLQRLTEDEIKNIYTFNEEPLVLGIPFDSEKQELQFKKDYLVMRKQTMESIAKLDAEMESINVELAEHQEELDHLLDSYNDMEGLIRAKLQTKYEETEDEEKKALYAKLLTSFDNALSLENVKDYAKSYRGRSIIADYRDSKKSNKVYKHYLKVIEALQISTDITCFRNLEVKFLVVDDNKIYAKRPNIFIFTVIHYIASWYNKEFSKADGLFVTQLIINLKDLYYNKFSSEEKKETFIDNIKTVIDIIG